MNNELHSEKPKPCFLEHTQPASSNSSTSGSISTKNAGCSSPQEASRVTTNSTTLLSRSQELSNLSELYTEITKTDKRSK